MVRGNKGEAAQIHLNHKLVSMTSPISANDKIVITESTVGDPAYKEVGQLPEYADKIHFRVNGQTITCPGAHGEMDFYGALANSCNCAFAQISLELGADTIESYAKKLGFLNSQSLSGIPTMAGSFTKGASGSANLAWSGIGQYEDLICPYSMLRYVSAIANGGSVVEPSLLLDTPSGSSTSLLSATTANKLRDMMNYNVSAHYGTNRFPGLNLCAKTGTAEVGDGTSHAWFTGFLLDDAHPYAFVVLVENAGGGLTNAGAVANTVLQAAVNK